jgi:hypothetical protein
VEPIRRRRAANDLAAIGGETVDVSELPSAPRLVKSSAGGSSARPNDPSRSGDPEATSATKVTSAPATLVRKNPFDDPSAGEIPPPGNEASAPDRSKLTSAKNQLLAKARSGTATDAELKRLHALCRTLGDASCSN